MASIFSRIISGEIPAVKIYEDDQVIAFLDIAPASKGHTLVVPKQEYPDLLTVPPELLALVQQTVQRVAQAIQQSLQPDGMNIVQNNGTAAGQSVFHYHVHIIPRWEGDRALRLWNPQQTPTEDLQMVADLIRVKLL